MILSNNLVGLLTKDVYNHHETHELLNKSNIIVTIIYYWNYIYRIFFKIYKYNGVIFIITWCRNVLLKSWRNYICMPV